MPTWRETNVNTHQKALMVFCRHMSPYLWVTMVVYWYERITSIHWHGSEPLTLINLTWSSYSTQTLDTLEQCHPLDAAAPDMPSPLCPTLPFCCLPVRPMTNGLPFNSFLPLSPSQKPLAAIQITWDTENSLSRGPPTVTESGLGEAIHHRSYPVRVRGHTVELISYISATYNTGKHTIQFILSHGN